MAEADDGRTVSALGRLAALTRREFAARIREQSWALDTGIRPPVYGILQIVRVRQPISQRELSDTVGIDPGDMVALLDMLERAGYLTRTRDEDDRRRHNLSLTPEGAAAASRLDAIASDVTAIVLARLSRRERVVLDRLLSKAAFEPPSGRS